MERNPVGWFEIYVQDMARARKFYETVFATTLTRLGPPDLEMWTFPGGPQLAGCWRARSGPGRRLRRVQRDGVLQLRRLRRRGRPRGRRRRPCGPRQDVHRRIRVHRPRGRPRRQYVRPALDGVGVTLRYRFGDYVLSPRRRVLSRGGVDQPLIPRYFNLLVFLVAHRQEAVHRRDIFDRVWNDVVVSDSALSQAIRTIRRVLNDDSREPRFIRTVSRHGYQFVVRRRDRGRRRRRVAFGR